MRFLAEAGKSTRRGGARSDLDTRSSRTRQRKADISSSSSTAKFPASAAFDQINQALASDSDRQDAIKQGGAVFAFTLKNTAGETESWNLDLKKEGKVSKGLGEKPTG